MTQFAVLFGHDILTVRLLAINKAIDWEGCRVLGGLLCRINPPLPLPAATD